jgi:hypothetical protein
VVHAAITSIRIDRDALLGIAGLTLETRIATCTAVLIVIERRAAVIARKTAPLCAGVVLSAGRTVGLVLTVIVFAAARDEHPG